MACFLCKVGSKVSNSEVVEGGDSRRIRILRLWRLGKQSADPKLEDVPNRNEAQTELEHCNFKILRCVKMV